MGVERERIIAMIHNADFYGALSCLNQLSEAQKRDIILEEASLTDDISILGFVEFLISQDNSYNNHSLAAEAYIQMCFVEGAYNVALFHAREMFRLNPDIETKKFLLFFYDIPERLLPAREAQQIAKEILDIEPDYRPALSIVGK